MALKGAHKFVPVVLDALHVVLFKKKTRLDPRDGRLKDLLPCSLIFRFHDVKAEGHELVAEEFVRAFSVIRLLLFDELLDINRGSPQPFFRGFG